MGANLRTFYAQLRNSKGELYKRTTVMSMSSGIARFWSNLLYEDITKDIDFKSSNDMFISLSFNINTIVGLLNKKWFEFRLHFYQRDRKNQRFLTVSMFHIPTDETGREYIFYWSLKCLKIIRVFSQARTENEQLSKLAGLSKRYSNHCMRATAIKTLSYAGFEARHIMTIYSHRNKTSIKNYLQERTADQKRCQVLRVK
ncbi:hypothetical protein KUTeg_012256 [Tegillarca granosa]|uniref:Tyr recombinase domain-containing protein n=1 Tax=Tegillarca granosa TaxID=220873 RepID=A0ABQ9F2G2_TEGGR|nr:hypothetical protein KUTeg_012256 [Tegillarca granosa]